MSVLQALVLGVVQGLTEFLPVSSSGHLIIVPWLFHWTFFLSNPGLNKTFDVALHVGTFIGAAAYFRADIARYMSALVASIRGRSVRTQDQRLAWFLVLASIPGALAGALGESVIEKNLGKPWLIAILLAAFGLLLFVVDRRSRATRDLDGLSLRDAAWLGIAQALALSPGVSRSGVTMTAARFRGFTREAAVRFSFLMSLPIVGGAGAYKGLKLAGSGLPPGTAAPFAWGMFASAVTGFAAIWFLLRFVRRASFGVFAAYRLIAALSIAVVIAAGFRPAGG